MPVRRRGNKLERWEVALIKAMVADGRWLMIKPSLHISLDQPAQSIIAPLEKLGPLPSTLLPKLTNIFVSRKPHPSPAGRC